MATYTSLEKPNLIASDERLDELLTGRPARTCQGSRRRRRSSRTSRLQPAVFVKAMERYAAHLFSQSLEALETEKAKRAEEARKLAKDIENREAAANRGAKKQVGSKKRARDAKAEEERLALERGATMRESL